MTTPLHELPEKWEGRARSAHPSDAMLINKHARELREALTTPPPASDDASGGVDANQALNRQLDKLCSWKHLMSYNEAYFGEPEGELKATVYEIDWQRSVCGQCGYRAGSRKGCTLCRDIAALNAPGAAKGGGA